VKEGTRLHFFTLHPSLFKLFLANTRLTARLDYITRGSRVRIPPKRTRCLLCSSVGRASNCLIEYLVDRFAQFSRANVRGDSLKQSTTDCRVGVHIWKFEVGRVKCEGRGRSFHFKLRTSYFKLPNASSAVLHIVARERTMRVPLNFFAITPQGAE